VKAFLTADYREILDLGRRFGDAGYSAKGDYDRAIGDLARVGVPEPAVVESFRTFRIELDRQSPLLGRR
jgi:hypothetical protein